MKMNDFRGTGGVFYGMEVTIIRRYIHVYSFLHANCKCINLIVTMLVILQNICWSCEFDVCLEIFRT